jgi:spore coat polysaccharide biosynthesis protein SpsF
MIVAIVQARMGSTRLPGKSMADICGRPMLERVVNRVRESKLVEKVVVATSDAEIDNAIAAFCDRKQIPCYRGDESDVLDRFYQAAKFYAADAVIRITADCPLIDPAVIDRVVARFKHEIRLPLQSIFKAGEGLKVQFLAE